MKRSEQLIQAYDKVDTLTQELNQLLDEVASLRKQPDDLISLGDTEELKFALKKHKQRSKLTLEELELQTGISVSTIKRVMTDPDKARLSHLMLIARELGIRLWFEK